MSRKRAIVERSSTTACVACGAAGAARALDYRQLPAFFFPMPREQAAAVRRQDLVMHACGRCGHLFQPTVDQALLALIYGEYYANYPYDANEALVSGYREPFNALFRLVAKTQNLPPDARLLEIGCSRTDNLKPFADEGFSCVGVDPSPLAQGAAPVPGVEILSGFYEAVPLPQKVHVIVSRFSLEHIADLAAHLAKMQSDLEPGGLVFVQVPNMAYYFGHGQPLFAAHEHIQYFSLRSLAALFARFGFSPVSFYEAGQPSVLACFRKGPGDVTLEAANLFEVLPAYQRLIAQRREEMRARLAGGEPVVFYGCGLLLMWILSDLNAEQLRRVVVTDDNAKLWGKFVPALGVEVRAPEPELLRGAWMIVLSLNPLYHGRVLAKLCGMQVRAQIVVVEKDGVRAAPVGGE